LNSARHEFKDKLMKIETGLYSGGRIRPYNGKGIAGKISRVNCNFLEIANMSNLTL